MMTTTAPMTTADMEAATISEQNERAVPGDDAELRRPVTLATLTAPADEHRLVGCRYPIAEHVSPVRTRVCADGSPRKRLN